MHDQAAQLAGGLVSVDQRREREFEARLVESLEDGRFRLEMTIDDSSVYPEERGTSSATSGSPSFRTFRATDSMVLKNGETGQFTTATDKVSGEIVKVDVTVTVMK